MNESEALALMVPPGARRATKWRGGVIQIHLGRACDLACSNCTQGSQFGGKAPFITLSNFRRACESLEGYWGVVGIFGGNPALHPEFADLCRIARDYFPKEQLGLWCNHPHGKGAVMRETFNPSFSNLNVHLSQEAYDEFKRDWPESCPFGLHQDSRHSPVHGNMTAVIPDESHRWELISRCDINQNWSAMLCQFRGELRAFFCEVAGSQAVLNQFREDYPDTGHTAGLGWWRRPMEEFAGQVRFHCHQCLVPLAGRGALAVKEHLTTTTEDSPLLPKRKDHGLEIIYDLEDARPESKRLVTQYLGK